MLTPEQLALRQQGISGSENAALCGLSRWASPIDVYQAKVDPVATQRLADMESPLIRGILFEEPTIKWYEIITKRKVTFPGTLRHPKYERIYATPDGIAELPGVDTRALEVKNTTWHTRDHWGPPGSDEIDECYIPQVLFEMAVTSLPKLDLCKYAGVEPEIYHVDFDEEAFEALHDISERFWRDHVVPRRPPPVDASDSYARYIDKMFPKATKGMLSAVTDALALDIAQYKQVRAKLDALQAQEALLKNSIKLAIGEHAGVENDYASVKLIDVRGRAGYDYKRMCDEMHITREQMEPYKTLGKSYRRFDWKEK